MGTLCAVVAQKFGAHQMPEGSLLCEHQHRLELETLGKIWIDSVPETTPYLFIYFYVFVLLIYFYQSIVNLPCCVNFC